MHEFQRFRLDGRVALIAGGIGPTHRARRSPPSPACAGSDRPGAHARWRPQGHAVAGPGRVRTVLITDEVGADVADAVAFAREHGIDEIGIRGVGDENVVALDDAALTALRLEVSELGVRVASVLSPLYKAYLPGRAGPGLDDPNVPSFSLDGASTSRCAIACPSSAPLRRRMRACLLVPHGAGPGRRSPG